MAFLATDGRISLVKPTPFLTPTTQFAWHKSSPVLNYLLQPERLSRGNLSHFKDTGVLDHLFS